MQVTPLKLHTEPVNEVQFQEGRSRPIFVDSARSHRAVTSSVTPSAETISSKATEREEVDEIGETGLFSLSEEARDDARGEVLISMSL